MRKTYDVRFGLFELEDRLSISPKELPPVWFSYQYLLDD